MKRLIISIFAILCFAASVKAEDIFDYSMPEIPAAKACGLDEQGFLKTQSLQKLAVDLNNNLNSGNLLNLKNIGIEITPSLFYKGKTNLRDYLDRSWLYDIRLSVAYAKDTLKGPDNYAVGIRYTHDFLLKRDIARKLEFNAQNAGRQGIIAGILCDEASLFSGTRESDFILQIAIEMTNKLSNLDSLSFDDFKVSVDSIFNKYDTQRVFESKSRCYDQLYALFKFGHKDYRFSSKLDFALAFNRNSLDSNFDKIQSCGLNAWLTYKFEFKTIEITVGGNIKYLFDRPGLPNICDNGFGAEFGYGNKYITGKLSTSFVKNTISDYEMKFLLNVGADILVTEGMYISAGLEVNKDYNVGRNFVKKYCNLKFNLPELLSNKIK